MSAHLKSTRYVNRARALKEEYAVVAAIANTLLQVECGALFFPTAAAKVLGVTRQYVTKLVAAGKLDVVYLPVNRRCKRRLVTRVSMDFYLSQRRRALECSKTINKTQL